MRNTFIHTLTELAKSDSRIMLLTGDLGFMVMEPFKEACPKQFFNMGVAEQNAVAVATGLAEAGFIPFVYSIAPFAALRPFEFIRNGPVAHQFPVRIVGVGAGFDYGFAGPTHHAIEDVGVMRTQRGMSIVIPADFEQTRSALQATWDSPGPIYYSLGKNEKDTIPGLEGRFETSVCHITREGGDAVILAMGAVALEAAAAAETLAQEGISCRVVVVSSLGPSPSPSLITAIQGFPLILTAEAHVLSGGLGALVCEAVAEGGLSSKVVRCAVGDDPHTGLGGANWYYRQYGLDKTSLAKTLREALKQVSP